MLATDDASAISVDLVLPPSMLALEAGDTIRLAGEGGVEGPLMAASLDGITARQAGLLPVAARRPVLAGTQPAARVSEAVPPRRDRFWWRSISRILPGDTGEQGGIRGSRLRLPMARACDHFMPDRTQCLQHPGWSWNARPVLARLDAELPPGFEGRWDRSAVMDNHAV